MEEKKGRDMQSSPVNEKQNIFQNVIQFLREFENPEGWERPSAGEQPAN